MEERNEILELLPQGQFIITKKDGQKIKGRFSMYVLDRFCETKGIDSYLKVLEKVMTGMKPGDYATLLLYAFQDYMRSNYSICDFKTELEILDFIDSELDGVSSDEFDRLIRHAVGRMVNVKKVEAALNNLNATEDAEKKSELKSSSAETSSSNGPTKQD